MPPGNVAWSTVAAKGERTSRERVENEPQEGHEKAFYTGLTKFIKDCTSLVNIAGNINCPCKSCRTILWVSIENLPKRITRYGWDPGHKTLVHHIELDLPPPPPIIDNTRQPQMSDMIELLNDLSYIPLNNDQNETTQIDIEFFQHVFPTMKGYKLPPSYYPIKRTFKTNGLGYESIHACVNDCFLYRGDNNKDVHFGPVCKTSRWKDSNTLGKKVAKNVLHYFLIIPRLQHLDKSSYTAKEMTWHATGKCTEPGKMQHLIDGRAWKNFDTNPKSPGKDIDVYLRPLIDDLKIRQHHVDNDPSVSVTNELFALACVPTPIPISANSCVVNGVRFVVHNRDESRTTQNSGICLLGGKDEEMYYDYDNEDIINVDDDDGVDVVYSNVARGHGGDGDGDDRPPAHHIPTGCEGCFANRGKGTRKPNLAGRKAKGLHTG
nr:hypothetical protein [Tanacetum cinerariifolium]